MKMDPLMTAEDLAAFLQVKTETVYRMVKRGEIPVVRVGRFNRFRREDVQEFLSRCLLVKGKP